jgi:hypothetical protein
MKSICSFFAAFAILFLPVTAPAVTIRPAAPTPMVEQATFAYDADSVFVRTDNVLAGSEASGLPVPSLGSIARLVAAENRATGLRARHFSDAAGIAGIESDMAINTSSVARGAGTGLGGVHVELAPFGSVSTAAAYQSIHNQ